MFCTEAIILGLLFPLIVYCRFNVLKLLPLKFYENDSEIQDCSSSLSRRIYFVILKMVIAKCVKK